MTIRSHNKKLLSRTGFTLIELLLVVAIIGVLAGLVIPRYVNRAERAKVSATQADIEGNIAAALELYEMDNSHFPTSAQGLNALIAKPVLPPTSSRWEGPYIRGKHFKDPWGTPYSYKSPSTRPSFDYDLFSGGPDGILGNDDDIRNGDE